MRERNGVLDEARSLVIDARLPAVPEGWKAGEGESPEAVGWEARADGKLGPRLAEVGAF